MTLQAFMRHSLGRFSQQSHRVVGVAVDGDMLYAAQTAHRQGRAVVEKLLLVRLPPGPPADQARALKDFWTRENLDGEDIVLAFPQTQTIIKTMTLPASEPRELQEMVRLQAVRQTPLGMDHIAVAWQAVRRTPDGYSRVI